MKTIATLFTGGGLFDIGAMQAGYQHVWGIEYDDKIASVARQNGIHTITGDVRNVDDYRGLPRTDHLHASPPCPNFSLAKTGRGETETDMDVARAVCWFIVHKNPDTFTLENVMQYVEAQSFKMIINTLENCGYFLDVQNVNAADFGVPQTRRRLIVRASRFLLSHYPRKTKWVGWYQAIEDILHTLPETEFAPWQLDRLPKEYKDFMIGQGNYSRALEKNEPADTITANRNQTGIRAFLMESKFPGRNGKTFHKTPKEPVPTITAIDPNLKAFLMGGANTGESQANEGVGVSYEDEPTRVVASNSGSWRAFVVNTKEPHGSRGEFTVKEKDDPMYTILSSADAHRHKAFIVEGQKGASGSHMNVVGEDDPVFTIASSQDKRPVRAYTKIGKVVKMNIHALGRFQTVPDDYKGLTVKINGNGVPCLLARRIMESFHG